MTDTEITALAREYAEFTDMSPVDKKNISAICENFLKYTLRRYCLVEKSKVEETWEEITDVYLAHRHITYDGARYLFNEVLFPDLGKEVES